MLNRYQNIKFVIRFELPTGAIYLNQELRQAAVAERRDTTPVANYTEEMHIPSLYGLLASLPLFGEKEKSNRVKKITTS